MADKEQEPLNMYQQTNLIQQAQIKDINNLRSNAKQHQILYQQRFRLFIVVWYNFLSLIMIVHVCSSPGLLKTLLKDHDDDHHLKNLIYTSSRVQYHVAIISLVLIILNSTMILRIFKIKYTNEIFQLIPQISFVTICIQILLSSHVDFEDIRDYSYAVSIYFIYCQLIVLNCEKPQPGLQSISVCAVLLQIIIDRSYIDIYVATVTFIFSGFSFCLFLSMKQRQGAIGSLLMVSNKQFQIIDLQLQLINNLNCGVILVKHKDSDQINNRVQTQQQNNHIIDKKSNQQTPTKFKQNNAPIDLEQGNQTHVKPKILIDNECLNLIQQSHYKYDALTSQKDNSTQKKTDDLVNYIDIIPHNEINNFGKLSKQDPDLLQEELINNLNNIQQVQQNINISSIKPNTQFFNFQNPLQMEDLEVLYSNTPALNILKISDNDLVQNNLTDQNDSAEQLIYNQQQQSQIICESQSQFKSNITATFQPQKQRGSQNIDITKIILGKKLFQQHDLKFIDGDKSNILNQFSLQTNEFNKQMIYPTHIFNNNQRQINKCDIKFQSLLQHLQIIQSNQEQDHLYEIQKTKKLQLSKSNESQNLQIERQFVNISVINTIYDGDLCSIIMINDMSKSNLINEIIKRNEFIDQMQQSYSNKITYNLQQQLIDIQEQLSNLRKFQQGKQQSNILCENEVSNLVSKLDQFGSVFNKQQNYLKLSLLYYESVFNRLKHNYILCDIHKFMKSIQNRYIQRAQSIGVQIQIQNNILTYEESVIPLENQMMEQVIHFLIHQFLDQITHKNKHLISDSRSYEEKKEMDDQIQILKLRYEFTNKMSINSYQFDIDQIKSQRFLKITINQEFVENQQCKTTINEEVKNDLCKVKQLKGSNNTNQAGPQLKFCQQIVRELGGELVIFYNQQKLLEYQITFNTSGQFIKSRNVKVENFLDDIDQSRLEPQVKSEISMEIDDRQNKSNDVILDVLSNYDSNKKSHQKRNVKKHATDNNLIVRKKSSQINSQSDDYTETLVDTISENNNIVQPSDILKPSSLSFKQIEDLELQLLKNSSQINNKYQTNVFVLDYSTTQKSELNNIIRNIDKEEEINFHNITPSPEGFKDLKDMILDKTHQNYDLTTVNILLICTNNPNIDLKSFRIEIEQNKLSPGLINACLCMKEKIESEESVVGLAKQCGVNWLYQIPKDQPNQLQSMTRLLQMIDRQCKGISDYSSSKLGINNQETYDQFITQLFDI